ncbi:MAG: heme-binding protein [Burkholderiales bacterium]
MKNICMVLYLFCMAFAAQAAEPKALSRVSTLTTEAALIAADAALKDCRKRGAVVAVAVVDRSGVALAMLRDALSGMHTPETATRKAWTAVSFKSSTVDMEKVTAYNQPSSGIRQLPNVVMIGGGLPIQAAGSLVGGIGVSGAPGGEMDDECAKAGVKAIRDALDLE